MENMSENIRNTRIALGLSQIYVAKRLGISQQTYSLLENEPQKFSLQRFFELCKIMNLNPIDLLTEENAGSIAMNMHKRNVDVDISGQLNKQLKELNKNISELKKRIDRLKGKG
jgi:transcriptional regulator with XRE-family HTH domain